MTIRLATAAFAVLALTGCTATGGEPAPNSAVAATPTNSPSATAEFVEGEVPEGFVSDAESFFPATDPAEVYTAAGFYCLTLDNIDGNHDEAAKLARSSIGLTADEAIAFMRMSVVYVCPKWRDAHDAWVESGGPDRLEAEG